MKQKHFFSIGLLLVFLSVGNMAYAEEMAMSEEMEVNSSSASELQLAMRKLWEDHLVYTRNYIISELADLEDVGLVSERLLANQDEIGSAIKPYYGDAAGIKLSTLLREHILIATAIVKSAKAGNSEELDMANAKWKANGDEIASFLSGANPNWSIKDITEMLHKHLEFTTGAVTSRLKKDWAADIDFYDKGHRHMLMFAGILADGIIKQFPEKFDE